MLFATSNIAMGNLSAQSKKLPLKYHLLTTLKTIYPSKTELLPDMMTDMDGFMIIAPTFLQDNLSAIHNIIALFKANNNAVLKKRISS
ncbi:MAG: hypothetical protein WCP01_08155 [Methylococcaceae bacterium]